MNGSLNQYRWYKTPRQQAIAIILVSAKEATMSPFTLVALVIVAGIAILPEGEHIEGWARGLINFVSAAVYHPCLKLTKKISQPGTHFFSPSLYSDTVKQVQIWKGAMYYK